MDPWRRSVWWSVLAVAAAWAVWDLHCASAQNVIGRGNPLRVPGTSLADGELVENVFLPADRLVLQQLSKARLLLQEARYGEAVRYLGAILDGPEDYFFQPDKENEPKIHRSLKAEAQRLIGEMPRKGLELYQLQYGARARQVLAEAVGGGDAAGLAEVSRRFLHTEAGYEATMLLGLYHLDRGHPLAGALTLRRLQKAVGSGAAFEPALSLAMATCWLQAGAPDEARRTLLALREQGTSDAITVAGEPVPWFDQEAEALDWLAELLGTQVAVGVADAERWAMFRGSASRNATTAGGMPLLNMRWRIPVSEHPLVEQSLRQLQRNWLDHGVTALPGLHPLAVDGVVLMRTAWNLMAIDFVTGKRLWEVPVDDSQQTVLAGTGSNPSQRMAQLVTALGNRVWGDAIYGTLSSDGRYVYTIEDLLIGSSRVTVSLGVRLGVRGRSSQSTPPGPYNRLAAHDVHTGKLKWHIGGPDDEFALREAETFFLGPPLPLMGRLFVLGEVRGEIRLMALDARNGDVIWSQQLATAEQNVDQDSLRRMAGASPSYADGILVCPTSTGAVVAVELATRSLLWGYRYKRPPSRGRYAPLQFRSLGYPSMQAPGRWHDATACVVDGRVLVTPVESDYLHCLNLIDGTPAWEKPLPRGDNLYVACVHQGKVVLVGRRGVRAIRLSDGKSAWEGRMVELSKGTMPSGRGFVSGGCYYLPLSSAEVMSIDLEAGKMVGVAKSRKGIVPGNLVCYQDRVISQGFDGVETFYQLEVARQEVERRLAATPDDAVALSLRGEILLDEGSPQGAVACFRRAYALDAGVRTRELLRDALLEGLESQFAAHRDRTEEIESLLDDPAQWATYLRLMATGLQRAGEWPAALEHYLKLADLDRDHGGMEHVSRLHSVRRDRWVRARLAALREEAHEAAGPLIDAPIRARLQAALQTKGPDGLRRFLDYFDGHPAADEARDELVRRLAGAGRLLEAEMVLWQRLESSDRATAGSALAALAELLRGGKRPADAAWCYGRLAEAYADVVCRDGKTPAELLDALPGDDPVRDALGRDDRWPVGLVERTDSASMARRIVTRRYPVSYRGSPAPFLRRTTIGLDQNRRSILGHNDLGHLAWQIPLDDPRTRYYNPALTHGRAQGHLLLLALGPKILAVDTLGTSDSGEPQLLWSEDLTNAGLAAANLGVLPVQMAAMGVAIPQLYASRARMQISSLGPVTSRYLCYQRSRDVVAADPLTAEVLWMRHGVTAASKLFGDDQFVFAVAPNETEATVFRALDGELLGRRKVPMYIHSPLPSVGVPSTSGGVPRAAPSGRYCLATIGRLILGWREGDNQRVLELIDPWHQRPMWPSRKFATGARIAHVEHEAVGVLEPDGHFVLLSLPDGRTLVDTELRPEPKLLEILLQRPGDQYVLVTSRLPRSPTIGRAPTHSIFGARYKSIREGRVYAFDLDGKAMWPEPVEVRNQHLLLDQPSGLPVLTFACRTYQRNARSSAQRYKVSVMCVDKRTGRVVLEENYPAGASSIFEIVGDAADHTVRVRTPMSNIVLAFTDKPLPPAPGPGAKVPAPAAQSTTTGSLLNALGKALGDALGDAPGDAPSQAAEPAKGSADSPDTPPRQYLKL